MDAAPDAKAQETKHGCVVHFGADGATGLEVLQRPTLRPGTFSDNPVAFFYVIPRGESKVRPIRCYEFHDPRKDLPAVVLRSTAYMSPALPAPTTTDRCSDLPYESGLQFRHGMGRYRFNKSIPETGATARHASIVVSVLLVPLLRASCDHALAKAGASLDLKVYFGSSRRCKAEAPTAAAAVNALSDYMGTVTLTSSGTGKSYEVSHVALVKTLLNDQGKLLQAVVRGSAFAPDTPEGVEEAAKLWMSFLA